MSLEPNAPRVNLGNGAKLFIRDRIAGRLGQGEPTIVDLGCGNGRQWSWLEPRADEVNLVGIEPAAGLVTQARKSFPMWEFHSGTAYDLEPASADIVTSMSVLEHVYRRDKFMRYARACLSPGGIFYLNYDNGHFLDGNDRLKNLFGPILAKFGVERWYQSPISQDEALDLIENSGFTVVEEFNFHQAANKGFFSGRQQIRLSERCGKVPTGATLRRFRNRNSGHRSRTSRNHGIAEFEHRDFLEAFRTQSRLAGEAAGKPDRLQFARGFV